MPDERRQFKILYRDFLARMIDLELLSSQGDLQKLGAQVAAILAALSFVLAFLFVPQSMSFRVSSQQRLAAAWGTQEFLIATTLAVAGLFAVLAWNSVFPDRRDSLVLGPLPVRTRTIFAARIAAVATGLGLSIAAVNIFTGLSVPLLLIPPGGNALRSMLAYWTASAAAGVFLFCALLAVQGMALHLLRYRLFLRVSSFLQLAAFFLILGVYFLTPPLANIRGLSAPENQRLLALLPSFWFLGLFQELNGSMSAVFRPLAERALWGLLIATSVAGVTCGLAYGRTIRRIVEEPDIAPGDRSRPAGRAGGVLARKLFPKPLERALFLFTARTVARSSRHRLLLAAYGGIGLAIALAYSKSLIYGSAGAGWNRLNTQLLAGSLILLFFVIVGARAVFSLPVALPANWVFRITQVHSPAAYFAGIRKSLFAVAAAPVWIASAALFFSIWPGRPALQHTIVLVLTGILLVERSLIQFRKIPFACSYLPGKANLNVRLGVYAILILSICEMGVLIEFWAMQRPARFVVFAALLFAAAVWASRRRSEFATSPYTPVQFEELPVSEVFALDFRRDSELLGGEQYIDAAPERGLRQRVRPVAMGAVVLITCGAVYEQFGAWRDSRRFPQIGRSVNIGGRSLNIYCSGEGSPAVVLESGHSMPGYSWVRIQREIASFTRACWYDRAGVGWSDPGPDPNWSVSVAKDLNALLRAASIPPPYILVGHSMGGFSARVYNGLYPTEVAGMVLVDSSHEDTGARIPNMPRGGWVPDVPRGLVLGFVEALGRVGLIRLVAPDPGRPPRGITAEQWATVSALQWQVKAQVAGMQEGPLRESVREVRELGAVGDLPLVVLTAGKLLGDPSDRAAWIDLHWELARQSTRGRQIVVNSGHMIPYEAPESVIESVLEIVKEIRGGV